MSKESDKPSEKKATKPIRRFGTGTLSVLQVICFALLFVGVNYLSSQYFTPKDLSADAAFTLSPATRRYLESPVIRDRDEPIRMLIAFRRNNGFYDRVRALGEEYMRLSNGKVKLELLDPIRSPDRTQQIKEAYRKVFGEAFGKTIFSSDLVIIDARSKEEKEQLVTAGNNGTASPHIRFIESENMARFETDLKGQRKITGFVGEDALTTGLVAAIEGKPRQVYLLTDKTGFTTDGSDSPLANFEGILLSQNALTIRTPIAQLDRIPDEAAAVAIINPIYDFTPQELEVLGEYWNRPRSSILITLGSPDAPPRLRAFLRNLGITPGRDRVITKKGDQVISTVQGTFKGGLEFTKDFWDKTATFEGSTSSLDIRDKDNEDLINRRINPLTILETGQEFWGETGFSAPNPTYDSREDSAGPVRLAGAVIRGAATRDDVGDEASKMVVIANSDFLAPKYLTDLNRNFVASSANWLIGREELTGFGPRTLGTYKLPLLDSQVSFINKVNLFFLPAIALVIGSIVWSSRRA